MSTAALNAGPEDDACRPDLQTGWFGKIPALGDFISRRLPSAFITPWDRWLQSGMAHTHQTLGEQWEELYLTFPVWRFLLPADLAGPHAWAGVLMPSVDRVGRHFPLTLATPVHLPLTDLNLTDLETALVPLEQAGLEALDGESSEAFDMRTRGLATICASAKPSPGRWLGPLQDPQAQGHWPLVQGLTTALAEAGGQQVLALLGGRTLWWLPGGDQSDGTMSVLSWPLNDDAFASLILHD